MDLLFEKLVELLPGCPFRQFLDEFANLPYLGYLNWFIPVGRCVQVGTAWLAAIVVFYAIQFLVKQIGNLTGGGIST